MLLNLPQLSLCYGASRRFHGSMKLSRRESLACYCPSWPRSSLAVWFSLLQAHVFAQSRVTLGVGMREIRATPSIALSPASATCRYWHIRMLEPSSLICRRGRHRTCSAGACPQWKSIGIAQRQNLIPLCDFLSNQEVRPLILHF